jgi:hypothetical protein
MAVTPRSTGHTEETILAFMADAAALLGAVAAWLAAAVGGQHRNDTTGSGRWNILGRRSGLTAPRA